MAKQLKDESTKKNRKRKGNTYTTIKKKVCCWDLGENSSHHQKRSPSPFLPKNTGNINRRSLKQACELQKDVKTRETPRTDVDSEKSNLLENLKKKQRLECFRGCDFIANELNVEKQVAENIIKLFDDGCSIPFIARYRQNMVGGMNPDSLRCAKDVYEKVKDFENRSLRLRKKITNEHMLLQFDSLSSLEGLEVLEECMKSSKKKRLVDRARELNLEQFALNLFHGTSNNVSVEGLVNPDVQGLQNVKDVKAGLRSIMSDYIKKDDDLPNLLRKIKLADTIEIYCKKRQAVDDSSENQKYKLYYDFKRKIKTLQSHQILAINRGEERKVLSVNIIIPNNLWDIVFDHYRKKFLSKGKISNLRNELFECSLQYTISHSVQPMVVRQIRRQLTETAVQVGIQVFASNLRQLLLSPPLRGKVVMAIDPGFKNGCKVAVVSQKGDLLCHTKFFLSQNKNVNNNTAVNIRHILHQYECETIAIGNGRGGREAETFISSLIKSQFFVPLNVNYFMVDEQGVSIYSCSKVALEEFPNLDPVFISAVSIARRLQDPLSEYVKVEPKHLGVGMYQHDLPQKKLEATLDEIVVECVSFVGVDINSASYHLLRKVSGLNSGKAKNIIAWLSENCPFRLRQDLKKVKGIGEKTFEQCAGFIRILPSTARCSHAKCNQIQLNPLEQTWIHPEMYEATFSFMSYLKLDRQSVGTAAFISRVTLEMDSFKMDYAASFLKIKRDILQFIIQALTKPLDDDIRALSKHPVFRRSKKSVHNLAVGDVLTGVVKNVVPFGAFIDIGLEFDGLLPKRSNKNLSLKLRDLVTVQVKKIDIEEKRLSLELIAMSDYQF